MSAPNSEKEYVIRTARENDVKFISLWFTDIFGNLKGLAINIVDLDDDIEEMNDGLDKLETEVNNVLSRLSDIKLVNDEIQHINSEITSKNGHIKSHNRFINHLNQELKEEAEEVDTGKTKLLDRELGEQKELKRQYGEQKRYYDILGMILNDKGIKTKIIRQYVPIINKYVNKYLNDLDFLINFSIDENFSETIRSQYRDEFTYASFSEGEKMRIDLALLFTWRMVAKLKNSVNTNLLIMDEVFDSSLDADGTDAFLKIINSMDADTNVFVISHKEEILFDKFISTIKFTMKRKFSKIEAG